ncbi:nitrite reductase (NADH) large subunit [Sulfobacillus thermosulfidooxidans DSM 9293]|uniref:Nitrite reductase (NADH) large subunit n=1 Tax=Sulfobacillus thermosulfidooxidans (strain DSM 9293 / VKM B-1269 / AT-1) TaxID=929705 RepID=A0A1W1WER1_SULTA|nr:nitrite reductase large subunit NirB [Sulfobacillus thermosulfidooxidans]SMC04756.1 nitrite reductase (NADH) large subunit [Sulfobacillus thermosulfidooxidans DSM 9293]
MNRLVIIGHGMAATRLAERIVNIAPNMYELTIIGEEQFPGYDRIQLSHVLAGNVDPSGLLLKDEKWYYDHGITVKTGDKVIELQPKDKIIRTEQDLTFTYDELVLATGSSALRIPVPGAHLPGVVTFRSFDDCETMIQMARVHRNAVVIGGGLLGLEAAHGLNALGMNVTVVHAVSTLMERQLDWHAGKLLERELRHQGIELAMDAKTIAIHGDHHVEFVELSDGRRISADLVVMAVGIKPNVDLAKASGITVNRGIVVDDFMRTSEAHVWAVGECAEHAGVVYGIVAPLYEQVEVLAKKLAQMPAESYKGSVPVTKLKVSGVEVFSAGDFQDDDHSNTLVMMDGLKNRYKKAVFRQNQLTGVILYGDTTHSAKYSSLIRQGATWEDLEKAGLWGDNAESKSISSVETWDNDDIVCGCMGVNKGTIMNAIKAKGLSSVDDIRLETGASRSCGSCRSLVGQLLTYVTGNQVEDSNRLCACTDLSHEMVVEAIRVHHLYQVHDVMKQLKWKNPEGCSKCRPALNYYVRMVWPVQADDDPQSRLVNERLHANIQRDGTFSVVPRIYGGVTNSEQLRKIADVADKYQVPMIKITGGQRIDLLGVRKEDLPAVWEDLGMTSGYAYGKAMRTVKTCVGTEFCRFGTQDAIGAGIRLEHALEGLDTPHKVKMAVSGCPRNCAESTVKDVGVIGVEGGFDLFVGGNGGAKVRAGDFLIRVRTEDEVEEWALAFLQYYRENARYMERTATWVERVGIQAIRKTLENAEQRLAYAQRLRDTLSRWRDPWQRIVNTDEERRYFETFHVQPS